MLELHSARSLSVTEGPNIPYFFVGEEGFELNRNTLRPFGGSNLSVKKKSVQLSLVQITKICGMCFWNSEQQMENILATAYC
jgi:hypothetical protein